MTKKHSPAHRARFKESVKGDEFYTRYKDIRQELDQYPEQFRGKTVFCPCDSSESAFVWYFNNNFERLGLKRLMAMSYGGVTGIAEKLDITASVDDLKTAFRPTIGTGDFRSAESRQLMKECDIVVSNPPFTLKEAFVTQIINMQKEFCIVLPLLALGVKSLQEIYSRGGYNLEGTLQEFEYKGIVRTGPMCNWFITWPNKQIEKLGSTVYTGNEHRYYKDQNGVLVINNKREIPIDYTGPMAIPISCATGLDRGKWATRGGYKPVVGGKELFQRIIIQRRRTDEDN